MRRRKNSCSCGTVCKTPNICFPVSPTRPIAPATVTLKDLLKLIEAKCDQHTCDVAQIEIDLLYAMIQIEDGRITHVMDELGVIRTNEGEIVKDLNRIDKDLHTIVNQKGEIVDVHGNVIGIYGKDIISNKAFQLIENMVENLNGDLKEKYPSAELLKKELAELWDCIQDKQVHYGDWDKNFTIRNVEQHPDHNCDGPDPAPKTIKVQIPVDAGSTVYHMWKGRKCLFESLVDRNTTEPTPITVLEGKWINYCELKDVIQCIFPKRIANCKEACDGDGVVRDVPLCECVICTVIDTNSIDLTKSKLPNGRGNSIKADLRYQQSSCIKLSVDSKGLKADPIIDPRPDNGLKCGPKGLYAVDSYSWVHNFRFYSRKKPHPTYETVNMGVITVPHDGTYHLSANITVYEQCEVSSAGYDCRLYVGFNGSHGYPEGTPDNTRSSIGILNDYHGHGGQLEFMASTGTGKTFRLRKGQQITVQRITYNVGSNNPAMVEYTVVGGISYVGKY